MTEQSIALVDHFERGLASPICLTWELTYACNLSCVHCLSSSGMRDPQELTTNQWMAFLDELAHLQVFYVNIGGGEPTTRSDFWDLIDYSVGKGIGVKFSTNGSRITPERAAGLAATEYIDVQVSIDGASAEINDRIRGVGSFETALRALENLKTAGFVNPKISVVVTRENTYQLDEFAALADRYGATLRLTRLRPSGRGIDVWEELRPNLEQQRFLYDWLIDRGDSVLTGDSFFHLSPYGQSLPGLNMCGAGRVVCLVDPVGDVYACPFAIHESFRAGNIRDDGFSQVWRSSDLFRDLRNSTLGQTCETCSASSVCRGGCMAAKFFTGMSLDDPDPECVRGHGQRVLDGADRIPRRSSPDHSKPGKTTPFIPLSHLESRLCNESPVMGEPSAL